MTLDAADADEIALDTADADGTPRLVGTERAQRLEKQYAHLDGAALRDRAVAALGGVAYCAVPGPPQPSNLRASAELTEKRWILHDGEGSAP